jgi:hypothetical protein
VHHFLSGRKDSISVQVMEDTVFLSPPPLSISPTPLLDEPQSHDPLIRGTVTLLCHQPRKAKRVRVDLLGISSTHSGDGSFSFSQGTTLEKSLEIDLTGERLEKGTHSYVPSLPHSLSFASKADDGRSMPKRNKANCRFRATVVDDCDGK